MLREPAQPPISEGPATTSDGSDRGLITQRQALATSDPAPTLHLNDTVVRYSDITGAKGAQEYRVVVQLPRSTYMTDVTVGEVDDIPCSASVWGENLASAVLADVGADECNGANTVIGTPVLRTPDVIAGGSMEAITGLKVCTNDRNARVKGVTVRRRTIEPDGRLTNANDAEEFRNANCQQNEWRDWAECPTGAVAVGINAYFIPGTGLRPGIRQLTGIELRCAMVEVG